MLQELTALQRILIWISSQTLRLLHLFEDHIQTARISGFEIAVLHVYNGSLQDEWYPRRVNTGEYGRLSVMVQDSYADRMICFGRVKRRLSYDELTPTAKGELEPVVEKIIAKSEQRFVEFYNIAVPISLKMHMLNLLPGFGKKH